MNQTEHLSPERSSAASRRGSRSILYALAASGLSMGAPIGLCAVRYLEGGESSVAWLRDELGANRAMYIYVLASTLVVFAAFGFVLGRAADGLADLATTDELTGLGNRRYFEDRLRDEFARATRYKTALSLLILDVDALKDLNDRLGHRAGDRALRCAADAIRVCSRRSDVSARWGGDEFALLAPSTAMGEAHALGERIRRLVEGGQTSEGCTLSVGIATVLSEDPVRSEGHLLQEADQALYEAKQTGRNRVVSHRK